LADHDRTHDYLRLVGAPSMPSGAQRRSSRLCRAWAREARAIIKSRGVMNRSIRSSIAGVGLALALPGGVVATASVAAPEPAVSLSPTAPNTNQPEYWEAYLEAEGYINVACTKDDQSYNDGYTVPEGDWLLLVLKAGSGEGENDLVWNPVVGQTYFHASEKDISHVILCTGDEPATPTTPEPTSPEPTSPEPPYPEPTTTEPTSPKPPAPDPNAHAPPP